MPVPAVLASVGVGAQRVADDAVCALDFGVGVFAVCRADDEARAHVLTRRETPRSSTWCRGPPAARRETERRHIHE